MAFTQARLKAAGFRHLKIDRDRHGNVRIYHRPSKTRLREAPLDPGGRVRHAFQTEYDRAKTGKAEPKVRLTSLSPHSLRALVHDYLNDPLTLRQNKANTLRDKQRVLGKFCEKVGHLPFKDLDAKYINRCMLKRKDTPSAANKLRRYLSAVLDWAVEMERLDKNPITKRSVPEYQTGEGYATWTQGEIAQYRSHWPLGTRQRLALELLVYTGVRRSDLVRLGRQFETPDGGLKFHTVKGSTLVEFEMLPGLLSVLDASKGVLGDMAYLVGEHGRPYKAETFGNMFREWCNQAGVPQGRSAHGIRKAAACELAEEGATAQALCAIFGWNKLSTAEI